MPEKTDICLYVQIKQYTVFKRNNMLFEKQSNYGVNYLLINLLYCARNSDMCKEYLNIGKIK